MMYVGRIAAVGMTKKSQLVSMYRVSSRSFPNRQTKVIGQAIAIVPREGFETDIYKNPYIAYNCLRVGEAYAVTGNGTHVDPIFEKLNSGMRMRDAVVSVLFGMDYEHDQLATPRIVAIVHKEGRRCILGIVRRDALLVQELVVKQGEAYYVATYEHNSPSESYRDDRFDVATTEEACDYILGKGVFANFERPISAACAIEAEKGFLVGHKDVSEGAE
jgi:IMP cyclohydrolase